MISLPDRRDEVLPERAVEIKRGLERFGMTSGDADMVATLVLSQLEGALLLARTYRSLEPIRRAEQAVKLLMQIAQPK